MANDLARYMTSGQKSGGKSDRRFDEREKDNAADPDYQRQEHEKAKKRHELDYSVHRQVSRI
jgi:hypothetical protein